jgi:hypothetical protein
MVNPRKCVHKSKPRTTPLARSNPFRSRERRAAFDRTVAMLRQAYPSAAEDWVQRRAWLAARRVPVPRKKRRAE